MANDGPIQWADWMQYETASRGFYEKRALEAQKASVEFSKLLITNLILINAGALIALPATAAFIGVQSSAAPAQKMLVVGAPAVLYVVGLIAGLVCALATYRDAARVRPRNCPSP